jgi:hypothetical protein
MYNSRNTVSDKESSFTGTAIDCSAFTEQNHSSEPNYPNIVKFVTDTLLAIKYKEAVYLFNRTTGRFVKYQIPNCTAMCVTNDIDNSGRYMVCASDNCDIIVLPIETTGEFGSPLITKLPKNEHATSLAASPKTGKQVSVGTNTGVLYIYNFK